MMLGMNWVQLYYKILVMRARQDTIRTIYYQSRLDVVCSKRSIRCSIHYPLGKASLTALLVV